MKDFCLIVRPSEVIGLVPGWPDSLWLVVGTDKGERFWMAVPEGHLSRATGLLPVWPPHPGFETAAVSADDEDELLRHLQVIPDVAAKAMEIAERDESDCELETSVGAEDINWDD